jgi:hypothetical protein
MGHGKSQYHLYLLISGWQAVLRIRIQIRIQIRIHMFLGLLDPDPDPLVRGMDPDLSQSKNSKKNLEFYC